MVAKSSEFDARMEIANRPGNCSADSIFPRLDGEKLSCQAKLVDGERARDSRDERSLGSALRTFN